MKKHLITVALFSVTLATAFFMNIKGTASCIFLAEGGFPEKQTAVETYLFDHIYGKDLLTEIYGAVHNALTLDIIGDFEFVRDDAGMMQMPEGGADYDSFVSSCIALKERLDTLDTPLIFVGLPDRGESFAFSQAFDYFGKRQMSVMESLGTAGIGILDVPRYAEALNWDIPENYFLKTDVHLATEGDFFNAKIIAKYLSEEHGIVFPTFDETFDPAQYDWNDHYFRGNLVQSCGAVFCEEDSFKTFSPKFETDLELVIPHAGIRKEGNFESVLTAGYDVTGYEESYWVRNYGQWPQPLYDYENRLASKAPKILILCDSIALRTNTFLALGTSHLTVADPRYFGNTDYLAECLSAHQYDAVLLLGSGGAFYNGYPVEDVDKMSLEALEKTTGTVCVDTINDLYLSEQSIIHYEELILSDFITLKGWAADIINQKPLDALYLRIGEITIPCTYGTDSSGLTAYYGSEELANAGFTVTLPAKYLTETGAEGIDFILVEGGKKYKFETTGLHIC